MKIEAILFDLDDTLHDKSATLKIVASKQYESARLNEFLIDKDEWISLYIELNNYRIEKTEVFSRLRERFNLDINITNNLLDDFDSNLGEYAQAFPGAIELVRFCKQAGLKIGIVTNGRDAFQRSKIAGLGLDSLIDCVVTSGGLGFKKPGPEIFMNCLNALNVRPDKTIFIGDDFDADIQPAYKLEILPIWKSSNKSCIAVFSSDSLYEIKDYLLKII